MKKLKAQLKLWLSSTDIEGVSGDGKWRLPKTVAPPGSLKAATEQLGIGYRKAWGDLRKAERALNVNLVKRSSGGSEDGGTALTQDGKKWIAAYAGFRKELEKTAQKAYQERIRKFLR